MKATFFQQKQQNPRGILLSGYIGLISGQKNVGSGSRPGSDQPQVKPPVPHPPPVNPPVDPIEPVEPVAKTEKPLSTRLDRQAGHLSSPLSSSAAESSSSKLCPHFLQVNSKIGT
jgi:hypothetical protein